MLRDGSPEIRTVVCFGIALGYGTLTKLKVYWLKLKGLFTDFFLFYFFNFFISSVILVCLHMWKRRLQNIEIHFPICRPWYGAGDNEC